MFGSELFTLLTLALVFGIEHSFEGDHVVAVSTIVSKNKSIRRSSTLGALWGIGHTITLLLVGLVILNFRLVIPQNIALILELFVGIMLVTLGLFFIKRIISRKIHLHQHSHIKKSHFHFHSHKSTNNHKHEHQSLITGMIQGLAGSAALMLLVLTTVNEISLGVLYLLIFGLGTILGMFLVGLLVGLPVVFTKSRFENGGRIIEFITSSISVLFGISIIFEILLNLI